MENASIFKKIIKQHIGLILAGLIIGAAVKVTYFSSTRIGDEAGGIITIPNNKDIIYDDEKVAPPLLPDSIMPQYPTIYKSHGQITANIISRQRSPYGDIVIFDYNNSVRCFLIEGVNESCWNFRGKAPSTYTRNEGLILNYLSNQQQIKDVLVVGVGAGTLLKDLEGTEYKIDGVDINPVMPKIAKDFFRIPQDLDFEYIIDDGRHFLSTTDKKYDAIILDLCYVNEANAHLWTKEFYALTKDKLKDPKKGFLIASRGMVINEENTKLDAMIGKAMNESFSNLYQVDNRDSLQKNSFEMGVYIATNEKIDFTEMEFIQIIEWKFNASYGATSDDMLGELVQLFFPAAEKIREQTLTNWGKNMFLPL